MTVLPAFTTFRARLMLRWTLAVGLLLGVANLGVYAGARAYLHRWLDDNVRTLAATETASSTDGVGDVHLHEAPFSQFHAGGFAEKFVQIFDRDGRLVLQSTALAGGPAGDCARGGAGGVCRTRPAGLGHRRRAARTRRGAHRVARRTRLRGGGGPVRR